MFKVVALHNPQRAAKIHLYLPNNQKSKNKISTRITVHGFCVVGNEINCEIARHAKIHQKTPNYCFSTDF